MPSTSANAVAPAEDVNMALIGQATSARSNGEVTGLDEPMEQSRPAADQQEPQPQEGPSQGDRLPPGKKSTVKISSTSKPLLSHFLLQLLLFAHVCVSVTTTLDFSPPTEPDSTLQSGLVFTKLSPDGIAINSDRLWFSKRLSMQPLFAAISHIQKSVIEFSALCKNVSALETKRDVNAWNSTEEALYPSGRFYLTKFDHIRLAESACINTGGRLPEIRDEIDDREIRPFLNRTFRLVPANIFYDPHADRVFFKSDHTEPSTTGYNFRGYWADGVMYKHSHYWFLIAAKHRQIGYSYSAGHDQPYTLHVLEEKNRDAEGHIICQRLPRRPHGPPKSNPLLVQLCQRDPQIHEDNIKWLSDLTYSLFGAQAARRSRNIEANTTTFKHVDNFHANFSTVTTAMPGNRRKRDAGLRRKRVAPLIVGGAAAVFGANLIHSNINGGSMFSFISSPIARLLGWATDEDIKLTWKAILEQAKATEELQIAVQDVTQHLNKL